MPDYFGHELTLGEVEYWVAYNLMTSAEMYGIDYSKLSFSETVEKVRRQRRKREEQIKSWGAKPKKKLA